MEPPTEFDAMKKSRSTHSSQLTKLYKELELEMLSKENADRVKQTYGRLTKQYDLYAEAHIRCVDVCEDSSVASDLDESFRNQQKNFKECKKHFLEWMNQFQITEDDNVSVASGSSARSSKSQIRSARAKRLVAEHRLKALKERHQVDEKRHQLERKLELLDQENAVEEARIEEAVWEEDEEGENAKTEKKTTADVYNTAREPVEVPDSARKPVEKCDSVCESVKTRDPAHDRVQVCDRACDHEQVCVRAHEREEACDRVIDRPEVHYGENECTVVCDKCTRAGDHKKDSDRVSKVTRFDTSVDTSGRGGYTQRTDSGVSMATPASAPRDSNGNSGKTTSFYSLGPENSSSDVSLQRLASYLHEGFNLPKPELLTFSGSPLDYCKFITNFETNIEAKVSDSRLRLSYLIQYTEGEAKSCIEDCVLLDSEQGYRRAREILKSRYGRPHVIARTYIDRLVSGPQVASNADDLSKLALDMQK